MGHRLGALERQALVEAVGVVDVVGHDVQDFPGRPLLHRRIRLLVGVDVKRNLDFEFGHSLVSSRELENRANVEKSQKIDNSESGTNFCGCLTFDCSFEVGC